MIKETLISKEELMFDGIYTYNCENGKNVMDQNCTLNVS